MSNLEASFHQAMLDSYHQLAELGYRATYFLRKVQELGGVEPARRLISQDTFWPSCTTARRGILRLPSLCGDVPDDEPCFADPYQPYPLCALLGTLAG